MLPALQAFPAPPHHAHPGAEIIGCLGNYTLLRLGDAEYELHGPDDRCPTDWLLSKLPAGDWWTEWTGEADAFVCRISS